MTRRQLNTIVRDFEHAIRADAMKGASDPESIPDIDKHLAVARAKLTNALDLLIRLAAL